MKKPVQIATIRRKINKWKKVLGLDAWRIKARYVPSSELLDEDTIAQVDYCYPAERQAQIAVDENYHLNPEIDEVFNIDSILVHELIHIMLWDRTDSLPEKIKDEESITSLEEFVCNSFAKIIYDLSKSKKKRKKCSNNKKG